jgi:hypothetical protein
MAGGTAACSSYSHGKLVAAAALAYLLAILLGSTAVALVFAA